MRKPEIGMWETFLEMSKKDSDDEAAFDKQKSFYVGDAAGRQGDFSDSDKYMCPTRAASSPTCCRLECSLRISDCHS